MSDLKSRGKTLALSTSKPEEFSITILKHFHLYPFFDFIGAAANQIACAGVLYGYGSREELTRAGADYIIRLPSDLISL